MVLDLENIARIKNALRFKPNGMSITGLASQLGMNRNSVAKYLEILVRSGEAEAKKWGTSRIYTISERVPASAMMRFSSDMILMINHEGKILQVNDPFLSFSGIPRESLIGQNLAGIPNEVINNLPVTGYLGESVEHQTSTITHSLIRGNREFFFLIKLVPTLFDDGSHGLTIIIEDVSDQKRAERALAEREKLYHDVIDNIQDIFYRSDKNGNQSWQVPAGRSFSVMILWMNVLAGTLLMIFISSR
jgi:PAS domain S-box-containing protein